MGQESRGKENVTLVFTKGPMTDFPLWKTDPVGRVQPRERPRPCREKQEQSQSQGSRCGRVFPRGFGEAF